MKMKDVPKVDRPREKLAAYGPGKLSNAELIGLIFARSGEKGVNVVEFAARILKETADAKIAHLSYEQLIRIKGLGSARAAQLVACFELGRRFLKEKPAQLVLAPRDAWEAAKDFRGSKKEQVVVFYLDSRNQEVARELVSVGTVDASTVHPREVFEPAVRNLAAHLLLVHNHPSGEAEPSVEDRVLTKRLVEAGRLLGIELLDHVIVTKTGFMSMKEKRML